MDAIRMGAALLCGVLLASGCGGEETAPSPSDLAGTWQMAKCEYVSTQGLGTVDLIAGGGTGTAEFRTDNTVTISVTPTSGPAVIFEGTYKIEGIDLMRVTPKGASWYWAFDMSLSAHSLKLTGGSAQWDFNDDGMPEPAKWNLAMTR
jgi:hypothetical protein